MTPLGWLGRKTSTQTNKHVFYWVCRSACGLDMILDLFLSPFPLCHFLNLRFYESVHRLWVLFEPNQLLVHHMRKCIFSWWNSYIDFLFLKWTLLFLGRWGGDGVGGKRSGATSTSPKFDLFLFYMNSKHIMKLKITRKQTYNEAKHYQEKATITSTSLVMVPKEEVRKKLTRCNRTMIDI